MVTPTKEAKLVRKRREAGEMLASLVLRYDVDWRDAFGAEWDRISLRQDEWERLVKLAMKASKE